MPNPKLFGPCTVMLMETEDKTRPWTDTSCCQCRYLSDRQARTVNFDDPFLWRWITSRCQYRVGFQRHCRRQPRPSVLTSRPVRRSPPIPHTLMPKSNPLTRTSQPNLGIHKTRTHLHLQLHLQLPPALPSPRRPSLARRRRIHRPRHRNRHRRRRSRTWVNRRRYR